MSIEDGDGAWFRRSARGLGYNFVPVTWQGWLMTLALTPVLLATVFAGDPSMAKPSSFAFFVKAKALLGLNSVGLPPATVAALIIGEVLAFLFLALWKTRTLKSLD
jgi:uncharacterized membrane protein YccC